MQSFDVASVVAYEVLTAAGKGLSLQIVHRVVFHRMLTYI